MHRFFFGVLGLVTVFGLAGFAFHYLPHLNSLANLISYRDSISLNTNPETDNTIPSLSSTSTSNPSLTSSSIVQVPIAVYHSIRRTSPNEVYDVYQFNVTPVAFDEQLRYLHENDYHTISFAMLHEAIAHGASLPSKPIVLSFDDGWRTQFTEALPILKKYGFTATFFLYPNVIEHENYMTWDEVRVLRDAGMEIGSHSKSHQYMTKQTPEEQRLEMEQSKSILKEKLNVEVTTFAYPFGLFDADLQKIVQDAGYNTARGLGTGVTQGPENLYELSSYLIRNDLFDFQYFVNQVQ